MPKPWNVSPPTLVLMRKVMHGGTFDGPEEEAYLSALRPKLRAFYRVLKAKPEAFMKDLQRQEEAWAVRRQEIMAEHGVRPTPVPVPAAALATEEAPVAVAEEEEVAESSDSGTIRALDQIDQFLEAWENENGKESGSGGG